MYSISVPLIHLQSQGLWNYWTKLWMIWKQWELKDGWESVRLLLLRVCAWCWLRLTLDDDFDGALSAVRFPLWAPLRMALRFAVSAVFAVRCLARAFTGFLLSGSSDRSQALCCFSFASFDWGFSPQFVLWAGLFCCDERKKSGGHVHRICYRYVNKIQIKKLKNVAFISDIRMC